MDSIKQLSNEEIVSMVKQGKVDASDLIDSSICPTCFDRENNHVLYGNPSDKMLYEDENFECFLVGNPRAEGHTIISTKNIIKI